MRSSKIRKGVVHDVLHQYDKNLKEYDAYMAEHPEIWELSNEVTGIGAVLILLTSELANSSFLTSASSGIEMHLKFIQWVKDGMQGAAKDTAEEISLLGVGIWHDDLQLRAREILTYSLNVMQRLYREHGEPVRHAIGHYDKALQAIVADYHKKVQELEESKQIERESDEKIAAELGEYRKVGEKKSEKGEDGVKVERKDDGKWQERVRSGSPGKEREELGKGAR